MGFLGYSDQELSNDICYMGIGGLVTKLEKALTI